MNRTELYCRNYTNPGDDQFSHLHKGQPYTKKTPSLIQNIIGSSMAEDSDLIVLSIYLGIYFDLIFLRILTALIVFRILIRE